MKVIALTGRAGSGKDTAAYMLQLLTGGSLGSLQPLFSDEGCINLKPLMVHRDSIIARFDDLNNAGGYNTYKFAFPVYKIVSTLLGIPDPYVIMNQQFKDGLTAFGITGRELLQKVGTECFREVIGTDVWCRVFENTLEGDVLNEGFKGGIVSDCRFKNKSEYLKTHYDAFIIRLEGRNSGVPTTHQSEAELNLIYPDICLVNTGSYRDLMSQLAAACNYLGIYNCKYAWQ